MADGAKRDADMPAASIFMATHARVLDRRRFDLLVGHGSAPAVVAALAAYRNDDGGYGWGLEPDLRGPESQPASAMHAVEVLVDVAAAGGRVDADAAGELVGWLQVHTNDDGGVPFVLPMSDRTGSAPHWANGDTAVSSLQMTTQLAALVHRLARHLPEVSTHPWLAAATAFCLRAIGDLDREPHAYELMFAVRFLDAVADTAPEAGPLLDRLAAHVPADGSLPVAGGAPGETLPPLSLAPDPDAASRRLLPTGVVERDLQRLADEQQPDGGWPVSFSTHSPAAALEWRGYCTTDAVRLLRRNRPG